MRKWMRILIIAMVGLSMIMIVSCETVDSSAKSCYAADRAQIEDLQARYLFALDFGDIDTYLSTFTEDGVLDIVGMKWQGHEDIRGIIESAFKGGDKDAKPYPPTGRHNITNIVIKVDGDTATGTAYWFHYGNNNPERKAVLDSYGHYEDEMVKIDGQWFFTKRVIYNEQEADWIAPSENPSW